MMKSIFDTIVSALALGFLCPLFLFIAIILKAEGSKKVFFKQKRVGKGGKEFYLYKFTTMNEDAHIKGPLVSLKNDPRVTKIGKFIRYTNFNELPQLINVVKGEMSIVGPRPEVPKYVRQWPENIKDKILSVKPGITGMATIYFNNEGEILEQADAPETYYIHHILPKKLEMELEYIENYSFLKDLDIIAKTIFIHGIRPWIQKIFGIQKRY